jgi:hypothetical protein
VLKIGNFLNFSFVVLIIFFTYLARRLERIIKEVLDDLGDDRETLAKLLTGPRVQLAEELSKYFSSHSKMLEQ